MRKLAILVIVLVVLSAMVYADEFSYVRAKNGYVDTTVNQYTSWKSGTISYFNSSYYAENKARATNRIKTYNGDRVAKSASNSAETSVISHEISTSLHARQPKQINSKPIGVQRVLGDYNVYFLKDKTPKNKYS